MFAGMDFLSFEGAQSWWHIIDKKRSVEWMKRFDKWRISQTARGENGEGRKKEKEIKKRER
jgi:hypothetical protein